MPTVAGGVVGGVMGASLTQAWGAREYIARAGGKVVQVGEEVTVYIPNDVLFAEPACSRLSLCSYPLLDQVAVLLKTFNPGAPMMLTGHTDDVGGSQYKCRLSDKQAHAVAAYLWTQGVPLQQLKVISAGDSDPIASNRNIRGSAANRHIQIDIRPTQCS
ncbi:MAG: OmpA/MotB protein [uncultured bacterium]|nr:MAG: OmpA/MotB protein [uncultured bacterium]